MQNTGFTFLLVLVTFVQVLPASAQHGRRPVPAEHGMVVTTHHLASQVGVDILESGGNAVDAAVATTFALAVVFPAAGNVGGGGFLMYHGADGEVTAFNFREKAPLAATVDMFVGPDGMPDAANRHVNLLSTGVPGTVAGLVLAHKRLGSLPWADLVEPAVRLARDGFPYSWDMRTTGDWLRSLAENDPVYDATVAQFTKGDEGNYAPGELFRQPDLARTLERIRDGGHDGFYRGETARLVADFMRRHGGLITEEDLARYEAQELTPVHGTYRGYDVYGMPPPSSGGIATVTMLNILEEFDLARAGHNSAAYLHLLTEAMRRAFADRAQYVGDMDFNPSLPLAELTSKVHAKRLRSTIDLLAASESDSSAFNGVHVQESEQTTHFSIVDADGNTVSMTYTLEQGYGNKIVVEGAGFLLNNEMGDFNPVPGHTDRRGNIGTKPNQVAPEKRMLSSMTPTILAKDGRPFMAIGSPGGRTIINTVVQVILNVVDHGMDIAEAVEAPRIHHQWLPDRTSFEPGISPDTRRLYEMMGHEVYDRGRQGRAMGIVVDPETGIRWGAADSRSFDGRAIGY
ncbi:MAG: gamma-glutamyltransferase [Bacteroidetes bacterium CG12_big_fil_rev_8_21_14_0_65_60_17]|nr:MAG: gamma-glutamyltransferase [Bacteroidetes bacterium CG12_big_fil_rev_8_21_14_0_65_60_17]